MEAVFDLTPSGGLTFLEGGVPESGFDLWEVALTDPKATVAHLSADIGFLDHEHPLPATTAQSLCYRLMAGFLGPTVFGVEEWRWVNAVTRSDPETAVLRGTLLRAFPQLDLPQPRALEPPEAAADPPFRYWILTRAGEPQICLSTEGRAYLPGGDDVDVMNAFADTRKHGQPGRITAVVGQLGAEFLP